MGLRIGGRLGGLYLSAPVGVGFAVYIIAVYALSAAIWIACALAIAAFFALAFLLVIIVYITVIAKNPQAFWRAVREALQQRRAFRRAGLPTNSQLVDPEVIKERQRLVIESSNRPRVSLERREEMARRHAAVRAVVHEHKDVYAAVPLQEGVGVIEAEQAKEERLATHAARADELAERRLAILAERKGH